LLSQLSELRAHEVTAVCRISVSYAILNMEMLEEFCYGDTTKCSVICLARMDDLGIIITTYCKLSFHSVAVFLTEVQTKQIRINIQKETTQKQYKQYKNTVNTSTHFLCSWDRASLDIEVVHMTNNMRQIHNIYC
jgi:hypothetical protein